MPRGVQWSYDDIRNAERAAKIQAEANAKAWRKEQEKMAEDARRRERQQSSSASTSQTTRSSAPFVPNPVFEQYGVAATFADLALRTPFGSRKYLQWRYRHLNGKGTSASSLAEQLAAEKGWTVEQAWQHLVSTYNEEEWRKYECPAIEEAMAALKEQFKKTREKYGV